MSFGFVGVRFSFTESKVLHEYDDRDDHYSSNYHEVPLWLVLPCHLKGGTEQWLWEDAGAFDLKETVKWINISYYGRPIYILRSISKCFSVKVIHCQKLCIACSLLHKCQLSNRKSWAVERAFHYESSEQVVSTKNVAALFTNTGFFLHTSWLVWWFRIKIKNSDWTGFGMIKQGCSGSSWK